ncbi:MAG: LysE family translocator [Rhodobacterales bacterium]|nr:LysE family translocator [Rhodobacterales bacterium]NCT11252.1 LysE family translocator [Rhodobacterales bacterium]
MIVEWPVLAAFVPVALALNLTPGADMLFCLGQGLRGGPRAALAADAGIAAGCMAHVTVAGAGLGAVIAGMPWAFEAIRWAGVAYLLWLARGLLRGSAAGKPGRATRAGRAFRDGLVVNLTNPKVILFVLALLPQFVDPARPVLPQFLVLGAVLGLGGFVVNGVVGICAGGVGQRLARSAVAARWIGRTTALILLALAVRLAGLQRS